MNENPQGRQEVATLAGGCFWCMEAVFNDLRGVERVQSGFSGGTTQNPSYKLVCTGQTGHAEVVHITFNPTEVSYKDLLKVFFAIHNPTTLNRQGEDIGTQYRSAIFFHSPEQEQTAKDVIAELEREKLWDAPIVTQVEPFQAFFPAEEYHERYFERNPNQPYCQVVVAPKVAKFRKQFLERLKK